LGRPKLRSRRAGTGQINRPAEPAGIAILESNVADILADYREWRDQQAARVSTHSGGCHMWHKDCMIHRLADALGRARLTDEEREAVAYFWTFCDENVVPEIWIQHGASLRGLAERTK
jgi:hypothetical protein